VLEPALPKKRNSIVQRIMLSFVDTRKSSEDENWLDDVTVRFD
jgi:hypothetical protein